MDTWCCLIITPGKGLVLVQGSKLASEIGCDHKSEGQNTSTPDPICHQPLCYSGLCLDTSVHHVQLGVPVDFALYSLCFRNGQRNHRVMLEQLEAV